MSFTLRQSVIRWDIRYLAKINKLQVTFIFIALTLLSPLTSSTQILSTDVWHSGYLVTNEGDTLRGSIKYNMETRTVLQSLNGRNVNAFTPQKIIYFEIRDEIQNRLRRFYTLPYDQVRGYETMTIFEVLVDGEIYLLSRERREVVQRSDYYWGVFYNYGQEVLQRSFFLLKADENSKITPFDGRTKTLLDFVGPKYEQDMKDFVRTNRLKLNRAGDVARAINHYNKLFY